MFELFNTVLRAKASHLKPGGRYPRAAGDETDGNTAGKFVTTIHAITSGIVIWPHNWPSSSPEVYCDE